ncbi:MAG TPA: nucleoside triphosphate pyrophosphohydrolase family protein [bacterium]|nr:nucleoside triphosphate pyrophosphohydrolase family protein [bacterium]
MTFKEYQDLAKTTAIYPNIGNNYIYPTLGLASETGEVTGKIKKVIRDNDGIINSEKKEEIMKELGDVLWYLAQLSTELKIDLDEVASNNLEKLKSRLGRNCIQGSGDNR